MTVLQFMEFLRSEGFTAEEAWSVISDIDKKRLEATTFSKVVKWVVQLKKEREQRRKFDPYDQER